METANRHRSNVPTVFHRLNVPAMSARYHKAPAYSLADALKHGGMILSALVALGVIL